MNGAGDKYGEENEMNVASSNSEPSSAKSAESRTVESAFARNMTDERLTTR